MTSMQGWIVIALLISGGGLLRWVLLELGRICERLGEIHDTLIRTDLAIQEQLNVAHMAQGDLETMARRK